MQTNSTMQMNQQADDLISMDIRNEENTCTFRILFCATNSGNSKTPLELRGGTSFELAVSSNCIELTFLQNLNFNFYGSFYSGKTICQEHRKRLPRWVICRSLALWRLAG
jgi:hypothetical protein